MRHRMVTEDLRAALATADRRVTGRAYPAELRRAAVTEVARRRAEGASLAVVARELGLSAMTLTGWVRAHGAPRNAFRDVRIVDTESTSPTTPTLVAYGPCGLRIEGTASAIAAVIRSLQ